MRNIRYTRTLQQNRSRELADFAATGRGSRCSARRSPPLATSPNSGYTTCPSEHANARPATLYIRGPLNEIAMTNFFNQKNPPLITGSLIGFVIGVSLIAGSFACDKSYQIPNGGGYTSEDVWGCLIPLTPTIVMSYLAQIAIQIKEPGIGVGFFVFHIIFYTLVGLFIGWIVHKIKHGKKS